jgi:hypothetical protein
MKVLVDTSVWSLALRRKNVVASAAAEELQAFIRGNRRDDVFFTEERE